MRKKIITTINDLKEKNKTTSETTAIVNKNKISYITKNAKEQLKINHNNIIFKRENEEFIHIINFTEGKTIPTNYHLKENDLDIEININTKSIKIEEDRIIINYKVIESDNDYEFIIEMR